MFKPQWTVSTKPVLEESLFTGLLLVCVFLCECVCSCVCVCVFVCVRACVSLYAYVRVFASMYACVRARVSSERLTSVCIIKAFDQHINWIAPGIAISCSAPPVPYNATGNVTFFFPPGLVLTTPYGISVKRGDEEGKDAVSGVTSLWLDFC